MQAEAGSDLTARPAQTVVAATRSATPNAEIIDSCDIGFGTHTVPALPRGLANNGGSSDAGSGAGE